MDKHPLSASAFMSTLSTAGRKQDAPYNYTEPDWAPLERAVAAAGLSQDVTSEFMWMAEFRPGVHSYKHRDTRSYAVIGSDIDDLTAAQRVRRARAGAV